MIGLVQPTTTKDFSYSPKSVYTCLVRDDLGFRVQGADVDEFLSVPEALAKPKTLNPKP